MPYDILQSSTQSVLLFFMTDSSDHIGPKTGLTCTVTISKNGAAFASPSGAVTEIANGWYKVAGNATDTNTLGPLALHATATGADNCDLIVANIVAFNPQSATDLGLSKLTSLTFTVANQVDSNVKDWAGTAVATPITAGVPIIDWSPSGFRQNTATAGAAGSITFDAGAPTTVDFFKYCIIAIVGGTGAGQYRLCTTYSAGRVATVVPNWITNPDATSKFQTYPLAIADIESWLASVPNALISGRVDSNVGVNNDKTGYSLTQAFPTNFSSLVIDVNGRIDVSKVLGAAINALISGRIDANAQVLASAVISNTTFAAGAIDSSAMNVTAENAIADALLDRSNAVETGLSPRGALRLISAALFGVLAGAATVTVTIQNAVANTKTRITATVDANGNRSVITTDVT